MLIHERLKSILKLIIPLSLGGLVLWLLYRNVDMNEVRRVLEADVDYGMLTLSLIFGLAANIVRGLRWNLLIPPIVPEEEPRPRLINAILSVLGSYSVNMTIPRAGELWRCAEYKRHEQLPFSELLGTLINDRLADVFSLGLILVGVIIAQSSFFIDFLQTHPSAMARTQVVLASPWLYLSVVFGLAIAFVVWRVLRRNPKNKVSQFSLKILSGISSVRAMEYRGLFLLYSLMIWIGYFLFFYITFFAFPFTRELGINVAFIAFSMSSLSALAPVQNGLGPWHFMVITTLTMYGVRELDAKAFALIVHTMQTLWIAFVGLVAILALPIVNRRYRRIPQ